ncbi:hypothetical protein QLH52_17020 [Methylomonas sp. OY6]|uniref:Uncharacterized protein n=1 Tax=Methylomonas defluvii TaxID=3045149 RepID=A0ABU4UHY4_9GAMM|nr:hypothetical protein [Methylomonas sp. OY6]MDX8129003.1 hypothetical protein [Methylomonas sp. OY6]
MSPSDQLRFAISDRIGDDEVTPAHVTLSLLAEFQKDVGDFLKGSNRDVDISKTIVSIEQGSLALVASGLLAVGTLWNDIEHLQHRDALSFIDAKRARIVEKWQALAQKNPNRHYSIKDASSQMIFAIDSTSNYFRPEGAWVHVEKYLHGTIVDIGGKTKANVHLELENGEILTVASTQSLLAKDNQNRLYRLALLHVTAEENLLTGELRGLKLLAFDNHLPSYDDDEFNIMIEKGTRAWADVQSSSAWIEELRGNPA